MKISIAMATYNGEKYLKEQLDSFVQQTRQPDEVVITDDCSADGTVDRLKTFAKTAPFDVAVHQNQRNYGYCGNFNQALMRTSGDLVFLSDQDDVWFPEKVERMARAAEGNPAALVLMNDAALTDADLQDSGLTKLGQIASAGMSNSKFVMGCCAVIKRDLLDLCLPIPEAFTAHDSWIMGIADRMQRKQIVPEVLQYYRRHDQNASQWIINRTTRVNQWNVRWDRWKRRLTKLHASPKQSPETESPLPLINVLFQEWAEKAVEMAPIKYVDDLNGILEEAYQNSTAHAKQQAALVRRAQIRGYALPLRLRKVLSEHRKGTYAEFSGWLSILRDLAG